jgi:hypothetical protein
MKIAILISSSAVTERKQARSGGGALAGLAKTRYIDPDHHRLHDPGAIAEALGQALRAFRKENDPLS